MEAAAGGRNGFAGKNGPYIPLPAPPFISSAWQDQEPFAFGEAEGFFVGSMSMNTMFPNGILLDDDSSFFGSLVSDAGKEVVARGERSEKKKKKKVATMASSNGGGASVVKGQWTAEEDSTLVRLVKQHGVRKWSQIAKNLDGRIGKQCRERWHNHLRPDIKKDMWTEEEERQLVEAHIKYGNRWAEIAKHISGRSENSIKNHWNTTKRRLNAKRKSKRKTGSRCPPSILQDYIRSKTLNDYSDTAGSNTNTLSHDSLLHLLTFNDDDDDDDFLAPEAFIYPTSSDAAPEMDEGALEQEYSCGGKRDLDLVEMLSLQFSSSRSSSTTTAREVRY
ncbi:hypothetical protein Cni_G25098 [Canna indica]|uniref:Transcription factor MYB98 n=1 Tax=Canna indica TaxID=4628 RepID=A0AAQ3QKR3_9LILI|nr:hypothetical protein Cni_G25098 [Canna indica]